ncbi:MAG: hypothetical protein JWQ51_473 [Tardiphaga sp.]|nr:hypothetical protein [Tardiphaga sp.]
MSRVTAAAVVAAFLLTLGGARAEPLPRFVPRDAPFNATLSNTTPLAFGMSARDAAVALGTPLDYVSGRPGDEIYLTIRSVGGGGLFPRTDKLFQQFRRGRLTGWKADWGRNWMWR